MQKHFSNFTVTGAGKGGENKYVFSLDLKDGSVTSSGRLFHVLAAAMEKARDK